MKETVEEFAERLKEEISYGASESDIIDNLTKWQSEQDNWISVEERLPEVNTNVLFYSPTEYDGEPFKGYRHRGLNRYFTLAGTQVFGITHWQPLPPPPKVKETEK